MPINPAVMLSEQDKVDFRRISDLLGREGRALSAEEVATTLGLQVEIEGKLELDVRRAEWLLLVGAGRRSDFARKFVRGTSYFSINQTPSAGVIFQGQREYSHSDPIRRFLAALSDNPAGQTLEQLVKLTGVPKARAQEILRSETRETDGDKGFFRVASAVRQSKRNETIYLLQEELAPEEQIERLTACGLRTLSKNEKFVRLTGIFANAIAHVNFIPVEAATVFAQRIAYAYYITQKHEAHAWQKSRPIRDEVEERLWMNQHKGDPRDSLEAILRNMLKRHEEHTELSVVLPDNIFSTGEREAGYSNLAGLANNLRFELNLRDGREWRHHVTVLDMARVLAAQTPEGAVQAILNLPTHMAALEYVISNKSNQIDLTLLERLIRIGLITQESLLDSGGEMRGKTLDGREVDAAEFYTTKYLVSPKALLHSRSLAAQVRHAAQPGETLMMLLARHNFQIDKLSEFSLNEISDLGKTVYALPEVVLPTFFEIDWESVTQQAFRELILDMFPENFAARGLDLEQAIEEPAVAQRHLEERRAPPQLQAAPRPRRAMPARPRPELAPTRPSLAPSAELVAPEKPAEHPPKIIAPPQIATTLEEKMGKESVMPPAPRSVITYEHFVVAAAELGLDTRQKREQFVGKVGPLAGINPARTEKLARRLSRQGAAEIAKGHAGAHIAKGGQQTVEWLIQLYRDVTGQKETAGPATESPTRTHVAPRQELVQNAPDSLTTEKTSLHDEDLALLYVRLGASMSVARKAEILEEFVVHNGYAPNGARNSVKSFFDGHRSRTRARIAEEGNRDLVDAFLKQRQASPTKLTEHELPAAEGPALETIVAPAETSAPSAALKPKQPYVPHQISYEQLAAAALALHLQTAEARGDLVHKVCEAAGIPAGTANRLAQRLRGSPPEISEKQLQKGLAKPKTLKWIMDTYRSLEEAGVESESETARTPTPTLKPAPTAAPPAQTHVRAPEEKPVRAEPAARHERKIIKTYVPETGAREMADKTTGSTKNRIRAQDVYALARELRISVKDAARAVYAGIGRKGDSLELAVGRVVSRWEETKNKDDLCVGANVGSVREFYQAGGGEAHAAPSVQGTAPASAVGRPVDVSSESNAGYATLLDALDGDPEGRPVADGIRAYAMGRAGRFLAYRNADHAARTAELGAEEGRLATLGGALEALVQPAAPAVKAGK